MRSCFIAALIPSFGVSIVGRTAAKIGYALKSCLQLHKIMAIIIIQLIDFKGVNSDFGGLWTVWPVSLSAILLSSFALRWLDSFAYIVVVIRRLLW